MLAVLDARLHLFTQCHDCRVHAQLKDGVDLAAGVALDFLQPVDVPRVQDQRLLADRVGFRTQGKAHVGIMQVVRRTNGHVIDLAPVVGAAPLVDVTVKALELGEEIGIREMAVNNPDRIVRIVCRNQYVAGLLDRLHMTGSDVTGGTDQCEILHAASFQVDFI